MTLQLHTKPSIPRGPAGEGQSAGFEHSVVGVWSFAIWSLVRGFGAATDCRQLSFAAPRPSRKVRSFAPKNDRLATERRSATPGHATPATPCLFLPFFQKCNPHLFTQPLLTVRQSQYTHLRIPRPPLLGGAVPRCPRSLVQTSTPVPFWCQFLRWALVTPPRAAGAWSRVFRS